MFLGGWLPPVALPLTIAGRTYEYGPGDCVIVSLSMPSTGQVVVASAGATGATANG